MSVWTTTAEPLIGQGELIISAQMAVIYGPNAMLLVNGQATLISRAIEDSTQDAILRVACLDLQTKAKLQMSRTPTAGFRQTPRLMLSTLSSSLL